MDDFHIKAKIKIINRTIKQFLKRKYGKRVLTYFQQINEFFHALNIRAINRISSIIFIHLLNY